MISKKLLKENKLNKIPIRNYLDNFFNLLNQEYQKKQIFKTENYTNTPSYDISTELSANIFGFPLTSGYLETEILRDNKQANKTIKSMLERILKKEEKKKRDIILVDLGINTGKRTYNLLNSLKKDKLNKINTILGIDSNKISLDNSQINLSKLNIDYIPINIDINNLPNSLNKYRNELKSKKNKDPKIIFLGLENTLLNTNFLGFQTSGVIDYLDKLLKNDDSIIFDFHNKYDKTKYVYGVEKQFYEYFENSNLSKILGGKLESRILSDQNDRFPDIKQIIIKNMNESVNYKDEKFNFKPWIKKFYNPKTKKRDNTEIQKPEIIIAKSSSQNKKDIFDFLFDSLSKNLYIESKNDITIIESKTIYHMQKNKHLKSSIPTSYSIPFQTSDNKQRQIIFGEYPSHYNHFLTNNSNVHTSLKQFYNIFPSGEKIIEDRIKNPDQVYNSNIYILKDENGYPIWDRLIKETNEYFGI